MDSPTPPSLLPGFSSEWFLVLSMPQSWDQGPEIRHTGWFGTGCGWTDWGHYSSGVWAVHIGKMALQMEKVPHPTRALLWRSCWRQQVFTVSDCFCFNFGHCCVKHVAHCLLKVRPGFWVKCPANISCQQRMSPRIWMTLWHLTERKIPKHISCARCLSGGAVNNQFVKFYCWLGWSLDEDYREAASSCSS